MQCKNCCKEIQDDSNFCQYCGIPIVKVNDEVKKPFRSLTKLELIRIIFRKDETERKLKKRIEELESLKKD